MVGEVLESSSSSSSGGGGDVAVVKSVIDSSFSPRAIFSRCACCYSPLFDSYFLKALLSGPHPHPHTRCHSFDIFMGGIINIEHRAHDLLTMTTTCLTG